MDSEIRVLELPRFIDDAGEGWVFDSLRTVLSVSIRAMQPLFPQSLSQFRNDTSVYNINTRDPETLVNAIISGCDIATINYSELILENFTKSAARLAIVQDENLSQKIFFLLISAPSHGWTDPGTFEENLRKLEPLAWHLPKEWEEWKVAIECLRVEGSYRIQNYGNRQMQVGEAREVVRSGTTSEHIWWASPSGGKSGSSDVSNPGDPFVELALKPDDNVTEERSNGLPSARHTEGALGGQVEIEECSSDRKNQADNRDWRSDMYFWAVGGNCPR